MEFYLSFSTLLVTTLLFVLPPTLIFYLFDKNRAANTKPPHARGAWPIIGHLPLLSGTELPHKILGDMADEYGPIFTIKLGFQQALVVTSGEMAKECFTTNDKAFASRPKAQAYELMSYNYAVLVFTPYGDYWRRLRKTMMLEVLCQRQVEKLESIRVSELRASINSIYVAWVKKKDSKNPDYMVKLEMNQWIGELILNIMIRIVSGKRFSANDEEGVRFQEVIRKYFELLGAFVVSDFIPILKCLDVDGYKKPMKKVAKELDDILDGWLKEIKIKRNSAKEQQQEGDQVFMNVLVSILERSSEDDFPGFDHDTIVKATCHQIITAGLDMTSATLTWAVTLLLNNPITLAAAQAEIDEHVGRERLVEEADMKNLVYIEAIIKETMRLYPAAPLAAPPESISDCILGGYTVPKGTRLLVNISKIHRDPNIWSYPKEFQPERFLTNQKHIDDKGQHFELFPFGSGRRMCPGAAMAFQEMRFTLASLIQQFVLKKPSQEPYDLAESNGITICKKTPVEVLLAPRLSHTMYGTINE
uniref:cytochrome P450 CYP82D47-like n=1 Tax=Erigeron canadensis TaxID=72917 RepID=UPI001CB9B0E3|nr:cytochrome P450 CYP82D47-like [Erigeron canadensis]